MAPEQNPQNRRPHYHRGRRGADRRGPDRRAGQTQDQPARTSDQVDVEQIMRDIRGRIAQRHGIELSTQQIQELAARRLEAILDPRTINPSLMQQLRRGAAAPAEVPTPAADPGYSFEHATLYESHRGLLRFIRRLLNPILKLFFNPNPIAHALHTQARLNREVAARDAERERLQTEWNALHYEIVQRLVTEVSRVSVEMQGLALRIEALAARVDFNDRRVRSLESAPAQGQSRPQPRLPEPPIAQPAAAASESGITETTSSEATVGDAARRRRRRRRGRRGGSTPVEAAAAPVVVGGSEGLAGPDTADIDDLDDDADGGGVDAGAERRGPEGRDTEDTVAQSPVAAEPAAAVEPLTVPAPSSAAAPPQLSPPAQPTPPPDEPAPRAPEPPDPGPPDR